MNKTVYLAYVSLLKGRNGNITEYLKTFVTNKIIQRQRVRVKINKLMLLEGGNQTPNSPVCRTWRNVWKCARQLSPL